MMKEKILAILNHIVMFYTQESVIGSGFGGVWKNCSLSKHTQKKKIRKYVSKYFLRAEYYISSSVILL